MSGLSKEGGNPSTRHWWDDKQRTCRQILSPYEMGAAPRPRALSDDAEEIPRHPPETPRWELPVCEEPVAPGFNPLRLCADHLAIYLEWMRNHGYFVTKAGSRGAGLLIDLAEPKSPYLAAQMEAQELSGQMWAVEKARRIAAADEHQIELRMEADVAAEALRSARELLATAEASKHAEEATDAARGTIDAADGGETGATSEPLVAAHGEHPTTAPDVAENGVATAAKSTAAKPTKKKSDKTRKAKSTAAGADQAGNVKASAEQGNAKPKPAKVKKIKGPEGPSRRTTIEPPEQGRLF